MYLVLRSLSGIPVMLLCILQIQAYSRHDSTVQYSKDQYNTVLWCKPSCEVNTCGQAPLVSICSLTGAMAPCHGTAMPCTELSSEVPRMGPYVEPLMTADMCRW